MEKHIVPLTALTRAELEKLAAEVKAELNKPDRPTFTFYYTAPSGAQHHISGYKWVELRDGNLYGSEHSRATDSIGTCICSSGHYKPWHLEVETKRG